MANAVQWIRNATPGKDVIDAETGTRHDPYRTISWLSGSSGPAGSLTREELSSRQSRCVVKTRYLRSPSTWVVAVLAVQMPLGVDVPPDTSGVTQTSSHPTALYEPEHNGDGEAPTRGEGPGTTIRLGGGAGSYMTFVRDCDHRKIASARHGFGDVAAEVSHRFEGGVETGIRGGYVDNGFAFQEPSEDVYPVPVGEEREVYYVNPYIGPETRHFGLGVGVIWASDPLIRAPEEDFHGQVILDAGQEYYPSGHLRIGPRSAHFSLRVLEGFPVCSGGGIVDMGVGWRTIRVRGFAGMSVGGVYDGAGLLLNLSFDTSDRLEIGTNLRLGISEGDAEYGGGLVLGWHLGR